MEEVDEEKEEEEEEEEDLHTSKMYRLSPILSISNSTPLVDPDPRVT